MALTGGSPIPPIAHSPLAHLSQASFVSTPGAHAAEAVIENLTPPIVHDLHP